MKRSFVLLDAILKEKNCQRKRKSHNKRPKMAKTCLQEGRRRDLTLAFLVAGLLGRALLRAILKVAPPVQVLLDLDLGSKLASQGFET